MNESMMPASARLWNNGMTRGFHPHRHRACVEAALSIAARLGIDWTEAFGGDKISLEREHIAARNLVYKELYERGFSVPEIGNACEIEHKSVDRQGKKAGWLTKLRRVA